MIAGWHALADDMMAFLIGRGVRPTPHRYAIVSYLADRGLLDEGSDRIRVGDGGTVGRTMLRRVIAILVREGVIEQDDPPHAGRYRLRPSAVWDASPPGETAEPRQTAAG